MPIYQVKKNGKPVRGKYLIRIHHSGLPHTWTIQGSKKDAEKFEAAKRAELRAQPGRADYRIAPLFFDYSTTEYKQHARRRLSPGTWSNRRYTIAILCEHFGDLRLDQITRSRIVRFQDQRLDAGISPAKINTDCRILRTMLRHAVEIGALEAAPDVPKLKEHATKGKAAPWTEDEIARLYNSLELEARGDLPDEDGRTRKQWHAKRGEVPSLVPMVALMLNCGLRKGEVIALEWSQVDLEAGVLKIWPSEEWRPKSNRGREVPIGAAVRPWLAMPPQQRPHPRYVFPSERGDRFQRWPQRRFDAARKHARLTGGPHQCRHTFASHFLKQCPDFFLLSQILGHSHQRVTAIYAHLLPGHLERARDAVRLVPDLRLVSEPDPDPATYGSHTVLQGQGGNSGKNGR